ncbi:Zinc finger CCHC-type [Trinorchestia longiramus]|nr:Zinc finger CCHC-type [Trinorchestia longiramus]
MKLENGQKRQDHLKVFVELFEELAIIGDAIVEEERVIILLLSLPYRFSTLVTALEAHEKIPAWEVVTERFLNEERRQPGSLGTSDSSEKFLVSFIRNKKLIKCFECGKEGHIKRQCRVYEERLRKENRTFQANKAVDARSSSTCETIMFTSALPIDNVDCDSWIVDSGATQHMCNKKNQFSSYSDLSSPLRIEIGDGRALKGVGVGDVRLKIILPNMQVGGLYRLDCSYHVAAKCSSVSSDDLLWHKRFCHLGFDNFKKVKSLDLVRGFDCSLGNENVFCENCCDGKSYRLPFSRVKLKDTGCMILMPKEMWYLMNLSLCHLRRSLKKKLSVFLAPSLKKKNMRIQKESWSSVVQLGTELLLIDLKDGYRMRFEPASGRETSLSAFSGSSPILVPAVAM